MRRKLREAAAVAAAADVVEKVGVMVAVGVVALVRVGPCHSGKGGSGLRPPARWL